MNRTCAVLLASFTLVALLGVAPAASAKTKGAAQPDLVVKKVSKPPKTGVVGSKLKLVVKVKNAGGAKAGKSKLGLYLGQGKKHRKKDKRLKRVKVKPLAAGKSKKLKLRVTLPAKSKLGSYRIFACADDTKRVKESTERNCKATRKISLVAKPVPIPPPAAAFTVSDGLDWGFVEDSQEENPKPGDPITLNLTAGNGIPGQAGYTRSNVGPEGFRTGASTTLDFGSNEDDGQVTLQLPFAFPFGGVNESTISVSTNGWVSFGSPAWDYWDDVQPYDYRGIQAVVGELERGMMPYWADLDIGEPNDGDGSVKKVVAADNTWVAFQWEVAQHSGGGDPRRNFQLVLFPDGKFRFDYPGENLPGGNKSFVGYSLGTGSASADVVSAEGETVPSSGLQFTPNGVPAAGPTASGEITTLLPKGSSFVSAGAGCSLTTAPGKFSTGLVSCAVPSIGAGAQFSQTVTFAMPGNAPGESSVANFRLLGTYLSGGSKLIDGDEVDDLNTNLEATSIDIEPEYTGGNIEAGIQTTFAVKIKAVDSSGLDEPSAKFTITNATLSAIEIDGDPIECTALGGGSATCLLPSGTSGTTVDLTVVPAKVELIELTTTAQALNAGAATQSFGVAP
jgi:hypothetical protein